MPLTVNIGAYSGAANGYQHGMLAAACQEGDSLARLADDFADRIRELRHLLGEDRATFAERWGRTAKQLGVWEREVSRPHWSAVVRGARKNGWPEEIFVEGGKRPAEALGRPLAGRTPAEPPPERGRGAGGVLAPYGGAARYYEGALKRLDGRVARGEEMGAEEARAMLMTLWDYAVREAPGLRPTSAPPAGDLYDVGSAIEAAEMKQGKRGA